MDIKNLKEVVDFGFAVEKAGESILSGGFHPEKLGELIAVLPTVGPAIENIDQVPAELADLDAAEAAELTAHVVAKGALPEKAALILDKSLKVAVAAYELVKAVKAPAA